jgi:hypothetical protein
MVSLEASLSLNSQTNSIVSQRGGVRIPVLTALQQSSGRTQCRRTSREVTTYSTVSQYSSADSDGNTYVVVAVAEVISDR